MFLPFAENLRTLTEHARSLFPPSLSSLFGSFQSNWIFLVAALVVLPLVSAFTRPVIRLAAIATNSIAAIVGAIITSLSAWCVLVIHYIGIVPRIFTPRSIPRLSSVRQSPILLYVCGALAVLLALLTQFVWTRRDLHACLVNGTVQQSCVASLNGKPF